MTDAVATCYDRRQIDDWLAAFGTTLVPVHPGARYRGDGALCYEVRLDALSRGQYVRLLDYLADVWDWPLADVERQLACIGLLVPCAECIVRLADREATRYE